MAKCGWHIVHFLKNPFIGVDNFFDQVSNLFHPQTAPMLISWWWQWVGWWRGEMGHSCPFIKDQIAQLQMAPPPIVQGQDHLDCTQWLLQSLLEVFSCFLDAIASPSRYPSRCVSTVPVDIKSFTFNIYICARQMLFKWRWAEIRIQMVGLWKQFLIAFFSSTDQHCWLHQQTKAPASHFLSTNKQPNRQQRMSKLGINLNEEG